LPSAMKYTALASHNNYTSTHGREYTSKSPKPSSTYSEGFNFSSTSPKSAAPAKGFVLPKSHNDNLTVLTQSMRFESTLNSKTKTTKSSGITLASATPSQKSLTGFSYNSPSASGMRNSAVKPRADVLKTMSTSTPKNATNYKSAEPVKNREEASTSGTQYKWKKLEISTEYNNSKNSYGSSASKAQTTKNTEVDDHLQRGGNAYTVHTQPSVQQRATRDERTTETKSKIERPLSTNNKSSTNIKSSINNSGVFAKNAYSTPVKGETLKKPSSAMLRTAGNTPEERMTQSGAFSAKKNSPNAQVDLRSSWQGSSTDKRVQRPMSAKKPAKEEQQVARPSTATKEDKTVTQKASLNSFVTKVNQGDLFGGAKVQASTPSTANSGSITATTLLAKKRESSAKRVQQKPMLTLDDKPTKSETKGLKTTPNADLKTFTINLGKNNGTPSSAAQKNAAVAKNNRYGSSTPKEKGSIEIPARGKVQGTQPFVYYMTGLEKAHKHVGEVDYFTNIYREHFIQSYQALSFTKMLKAPHSSAIAQKIVNIPRKEINKDKKTLVFDMDETLIHCNESADMPADVILPIVFPNGEVVEAGVNIRPYAVELLKELSQHFEIVVFTASHACYANVVLDYLDPQQQWIHHRLFRDSCVVTDEGVHIKDLRVIGNRNLSDMVLIDNAAYSFGFQIDNGIPIIPFYDNKADQELLHLIPYLKYLGSGKDMRELNKLTFKFDIYHSHDSADMVLDRLF